MTANDIITQVVQSEMVRRGFSRTDLAKSCGRTQQWACHKLNGHRRWNVDDLDDLARGLGMAPAALLIPPVVTKEYRQGGVVFTVRYAPGLTRRPSIPDRTLIEGAYGRAA